METLDQHDKTKSWHNSNIHVFWKEVAAKRRTVQVYDDNRTFLLTLEGFAGSGLLANERVVVIAMREHLDQLNYRLQQQFNSLPAYIDRRQYIPIDIADILSLIMIDGGFAGDLMYALIHDLLENAPGFDSVRIYSEISVLLTEQQKDDTIHQLDHCWDKLHNEFSFCHFRAFPKALLKRNDTTLDFYNDDSLLIQGDLVSSTEVSYTQYHDNFL